MNKEELEAVEFWKDCIEHLEKEFQYPNYLGYFITIRDKECEYLKTTLNLIEQLQQKVNKLESNIAEAIEYIKNNIQEGYSEFYETYIRCDAVSGDDLLSILERGKE